MTFGPENIVKSFRPFFGAMGSNIFCYGEQAGNSQPLVSLYGQRETGIETIKLGIGKPFMGILFLVKNLEGSHVYARENSDYYRWRQWFWKRSGVKTG
jgi:hypothetical protein